MRIRKRSLPQGWYPGSSSGIESLLSKWAIEEAAFHDAAACVVPHAGWTYSGRLAFEALRRLDPDTATFVVVGGHMHAGSGILIAMEDAFETPAGLYAADTELRELLVPRVGMREDIYADNTVEVQLPLLRHLFPDSLVLSLRAEPGSEAAILGRAIAEAGAESGKRVCVVGSTDLTHYGPAYGFSPAGSGERAVRWVKESNDGELISSLLAMEIDRAIEKATVDRAACSIGGAVAAMSYAAALGIGRGTLVGYMNSFDIHPSDSFVGYVGIAYRRESVSRP